MKTQTQTSTKTANIETVATIDLDKVTGGCAACGMPNCTMGPNPAVKAPLFSAFNRR